MKLTMSTSLIQICYQKLFSQMEQVLHSHMMVYGDCIRPKMIVAMLLLHTTTTTETNLSMVSEEV